MSALYANGQPIVETDANTRGYSMTWEWNRRPNTVVSDKADVDKSDVVQAVRKRNSSHKGRRLRRQAD